jgi:hypothetical protein
MVPKWKIKIHIFNLLTKKIQELLAFLDFVMDMVNLESKLQASWQRNVKLS